MGTLKIADARVLRNSGRTKRIDRRRLNQNRASSISDDRQSARAADFKMDQLLLYFSAMILTLTRAAYFHGALCAENRVLIKDDADA
jgi:hypothetical protein